jgi:HD-like signal output (HDOD) protein
VRQIPQFPPIAARLLTLLSQQFVSMPSIAELIGSDPTFSARLLQCVNSALFGLSYPVTDVLQALSILGLDRTRQLTVTLATR